MNADEARAELLELERFYASLSAQNLLGEHVCCAAQPESPNGSPETLVEEGVSAAARITASWGDAVLEAIGERSTEFEIRSALERVRIDASEFAREIEQTILRGLMLGALDSLWEREHDEELAPATFAERRPPGIVHLPGETAIAEFEARNVLPPAAFRALQDGAKRQAFTVAGMAKEELLNVTKAELVRQLREGQGRRPGTPGSTPRGADLRDFQRFARKRLETAGWTPDNPSHVETIFRTNSMSAVASGRRTEMSQPAVLAALPYWQIRGVTDARQRETHKRAHGIVLPANHPFWKLAYPPFGFNCRCRVIARTKAWLSRNGVTEGPVPVGLPDPGFESGTSQLISVPPAALAPPPAPQRPPVPVRPPVPARPVPPAIDLPTPSLGPPAPPIQLPPIALPPVAAPATYAEFTAAAIEVEAIELKHLHAVSEKGFGRALTPQEYQALVSPTTFDPGHRLDDFRISADRSTIDLKARIVDREGNYVATVQRDYKLEKDGTMVVHHGYLRVDKAHKGTGIGSRVLLNNLEQYEKLGVKKIKLEAAWDGQYVWARAGFDTNATQLARLKTEFKRAYPHIPASAVDALPRARDLALLEVEGKQVGKEFLIARGKTDADLIPMSAPVAPGDAKYEQLKDYFRKSAAKRDQVVDHFAKAAAEAEAQRQLEAARAALQQAATAERRAALPGRFNAALERTASGQLANGAEARVALRDLVRETVPRARDTVLGEMAVSGEDVAVRNFEAMFEPGTGRVVYSPDVVDRARRAMQRISAGPIKSLTPEIRRELDGLRVMVHEEVHSLSGNDLFDVTPHSVVVEEIGTELTARRVMRQLVPKLKLSDAGMAYSSEISAIRYRLQKLKGIGQEEALELMAQAHERAALVRTSGSGAEGVSEWLRELGLTAEQREQMLTELAKVQSRMIGGVK
jgi:GNAT superfamily N-acetyltransferase